MNITTLSKTNNALIARYAANNDLAYSLHTCLTPIPRQIETIMIKIRSKMHETPKLNDGNIVLRLSFPKKCEKDKYF